MKFSDYNNKANNKSNWVYDKNDMLPKKIDDATVELFETIDDETRAFLEPIDLDVSDAIDDKK